ncbi:class II aldolase/adducin family protein [Pseudonocardia xinjiangensis]|uniref:Aldolase n=1 Tax=Pseudonocardia xinjiangensis TaxID=75289 RepID=A0ABX1RCV3_9PSEU|nr:class II aldolase/adducin family protein [Pseudonocardia xinjiangensis]NMH77275.1 aldolase [Pseudonocardia xinjiangensis]
MLRRELVAAAAQLAGAGMSPGSSGNLSVRHGDRIIISPTGSDLASLIPERLSELDFDATLLSGPAPSKEYPFHRAFYRRDETVRAVVHVHSLAASAYSCLDPWSERSAVPPLTPYFVMRVGQTPLIPYADPGDAAQADAIEASDSRFRAALLQNHGAITAGRTVREALDAAVELEQTCALLLQLGSRPFRLLPAEAVDRLATKYDSPWG